MSFHRLLSHFSAQPQLSLEDRARERSTLANIAVEDVHEKAGRDFYCVEQAIAEREARLTFRLTPEKIERYRKQDESALRDVAKALKALPESEESRERA